MAIGGGAGIASSIFGSDAEKRALERQKESAMKQYTLGKAYSDQQYALSRGEALTQAGIQKGRLDRNLGRSVDQFSLGLMSQAYGIQDARIQTALSAGESLAAEGMSGTRGNDANALARAYGERGLERNIALQQRDNEMSLAGLLGQAEDAAADIRREKDSWDYGGYRYAQKQAQDNYNLHTALLGQEDLNWQIEQASWSPLDLLTGGLQGASSGLSLWNSWNAAGRFMDGGKEDGGTGSGTGSRITKYPKPRS
jgi:hypothetical protein